MQTICPENKCTGCGACYNSCPHNCISMEFNEKGYLHPSISSECVDCKVCQKVCPILNDVTRNERIFPTVYLAHSKDEEIVRNAASGGIATVINKYFVEKKNGYACGIKFNDKFLAVFSILGGDNSDGLQCLSHSKYVQSCIEDGYRQIKEKLDNQKHVFFCGLPCQVAGLYSYLGKEYENLLTADIVCHGTSSPIIFQKYIKYMEEKLDSKIKSICQTDKKYGWSILIPKLVCIETADGHKHYYDSKKDSYLHMFLENVMLRPACSSCKYQVMPRIGDLTLGDFFGIGTVRSVKKLNRYGESMVMVNTVKGQKAFEQIQDEIYCEHRELEEALYFNHNLWRSSKPNKRHAEFEKDMTSLTYEEICSKYYRASAFSKVIIVIRYLIKKILGLRLAIYGMLLMYKYNGTTKLVDSIISDLKAEFGR